MQMQVGEAGEVEWWCSGDMDCTGHASAQLRSFELLSFIRAGLLNQVCVRATPARLIMSKLFSQY